MDKHKFAFCFIFILFSQLCAKAYAEDIVHTIEKGETLYALSKRYRVPVSLILETNNLTDNSKIKAGQKLIIPSALQKKTSEAVSLAEKPRQTEKMPSSAKKHMQEKTDAPQTYKIQNGDTLFGISRKFGVNFSELLWINGFIENTVIKTGQSIKLPKPGAAYSGPKGGTTASSSKAVKKSSQRPPSGSGKQADPSLLWPVPASEVSYLSGKIAGVVIDSKKGQDVKAIASGKVVSTGTHRGFGQVVFVQSKTKHIYVYGGLEKISVKKDDTVKTGKKLGELGSELFTGKARLYFMVYNKNTPIDPQKAPRGI